MVVSLSDALAWVQTVLARRGEPLPRVIQLLPHIEPAMHYVEVPSADAFDRWRAVREVTPQTGLWPVLLGEPRWVHLHAQSAEHDASKGPQTWSGVSAAQIIEEAEPVSAGDWLVGRHAALPEPARPEHDWAHGPWPEGILPRRTFT